MKSTSCTSTSSFFFFNDTATTEIYTLSLHDALPIYLGTTSRLPRRPFDLDDAFVDFRHFLLKKLDEHPRMSTRSEEHTSELQSQSNLVCRLLLEKKKNTVASAQRAEELTHSLVSDAI